MLTLLTGWKAETAELELPVPKGWRFDPSEYKSSPRIPLQGGACRNAIWFDVFPGSSVDFVKQLIATESIHVTAAIRHWHVLSYADVTLAKHPASVFRLEERSVYLVPSDHGVLVAQAAAARRYWDLRRAPDDLERCADGGVMEFLLGLEAPDRVVQLYGCGPGHLRAWELDAGWSSPDEALTKRVEQLLREGVISAPLDETVRGGTVTKLRP